MAASDSPLVDVGVSFICDDHGGPVDGQHEPFIRAVLGRFCSKMISPNECKILLSPFLSTTRSIDRIDSIIHCCDSPIPSSPGSRFAADSDPKRHTNPWTTAEDNRLLCAVHRFGTRSWPRIAEFVGNDRTRSQCAQRWNRNLDPRLSKDHWSSAEDTRLLNLVARHGYQGWKWLSQQMGNRSDVQCRYRFLQLRRLGKDIPADPQMPIAADIGAKKRGRPMKELHFDCCATADGKDAPVQPPSDPIDCLIDWSRIPNDGVDTIDW